MVGDEMQIGVAIVRPHAFTFLPLSELGAAEQFAFGASSAKVHVRMDPSWQTRYPLLACWNGGDFDRIVTETAYATGGLAIGRVDGEVVRTKFATAFQTHDGIAIGLAEHPPHELLAGWPVGVEHFDANARARNAMLASAFALLPAGACGVIAAVDDSSAVWGVVFWLSWIPLIWVHYFWERAAHARKLRNRQTQRANAIYR